MLNVEPSGKVMFEEFDKALLGTIHRQYTLYNFMKNIKSISHSGISCGLTLSLGVLNT